MALFGRSNGAQVQKRLSALQDDLGRLQRDLRGLAAAGGSIAGARMADAIEDAEDLAIAAAGQAANKIESWTNGNLDPVRQQVRSQPLASLLLSVGAGALVGALLLGTTSRLIDDR